MNSWESPGTVQSERVFSRLSPARFAARGHEVPRDWMWPVYGPSLLRCRISVQPMSQLGQKRKGSRRAYSVRITPMCGRLRVGKENLHVADWSVQPCVRPVGAVHTTAGHNALRGSGPGQKPAFDNARG